MDLELLRQKSPAIAELVERWESKYARAYDLTDAAEQATFFEGVLEAARSIASASSTGRLTLNVTNDGISGLVVSAAPIPPHDAS